MLAVDSLGVLDTKYKDTTAPGAADVQQMVAYAVRMGTDKAILIYPVKTRGAAIPIDYVSVIPASKEAIESEPTTLYHDDTVLLLRN